MKNFFPLVKTKNNVRTVGKMLSVPCVIVDDLGPALPTLERDDNSRFVKTTFYVQLIYHLNSNN